MGTLYLQQSVCILPDQPELRKQLERIAARVSDLGGSYHLLSVGMLGDEERNKLVAGFVAQSDQQYDEIIENCEVNFTKEIEFEVFRENFIYAEAEEIRNDLEKIRRWFNRVVERDWYEAPRRREASEAIEKCEQLLEQFEERVYAAESATDMQGHAE
jgi:phosphomevalonate kinase